MRSSPFYAIAWAAIVTFGLSGVPRFLSVLSDFISVENDSLGYKRLFTGGVLLVHASYILALILAAIFYPRRPAFTRSGIIGSAAVCSFVIGGLVFYHSNIDRTYSVVIQFVDSSGNHLSELPVVVEHKIEGFTPTTSPERTKEMILSDGLLSVSKSIREMLTISAHLPGLTHVQVKIPPMGAPYYPGPLQMVQMSWFIDPKGGHRDTYVGGQ